MSLNMQQLIRYVDEEIHKLEFSAVGVNEYRKPEFPMLVVYLGDGTEAHEALSAHLCRLWPAFRNDLRFLEAARSGDTVSLSRLTAQDLHREPCQMERLSELVDELFDSATNFRNHSNLIVYYILDTTSFQKPEELFFWTNVAEQLQTAMDIDPTISNNLLFLMLHGGVTRRSVHNGIRNYLADFSAGRLTEQLPMKNVVVISKYLDNGTILTDWSEGYQIVSAAMALSNDRDAYVRTPFFRYPVVTPYYSRVQKATEEIGQVVVTQFLETLSHEIKTTAALSLEALPQLRERLGKEKDGTFTFLNQYVQQHIHELLPAKDQLAVFPRREPDGYVDMVNLTAQEFDDYTMGAWSAFLQGLADRMIAEITGAGWKESYAQLLQQNFTPGELRCLSHNRAKVAEELRRVDVPPQNGDVFTMARNYLQFYLSSRPNTLRLLGEAVRQSGESAKQFDAMWRALIESELEVHMTENQVLKTFYSKKVKAYFDYHPAADIAERLQRCRNEQELEAVVKEHLDQILRSDTIFAAPFADELTAMLNEQGLPQTPAQYIHTRLSDGHTYLKAAYQPDEKAGTAAILMDKDQDALYKGLWANLTEEVFCYDTSMANSVEYLQMFAATDQNLMV